MNRPLVSVIVPVYKVEQYLDKCVSSIVSQTYKNLEIILVDDGSPDNSPKICDEWAEKDERIKVIHKENGGVSSARNIALDNSSGEYITFVDSDDWIDVQMIESLYDELKKNNADISICSFVFEKKDGTSEYLEQQKSTFDGKEILYNYLLDSIRPEIAAKLICRKTIGAVRLNESFGYAEDLLFNYEVFKNADKVVLLSDCFYHYLQESGSSSTTPYITENRAKSYLVFERLIDECMNDEYLFDAALWRYTVATFAVLSRVITDKDISGKYYDCITASLLSNKKEIFKSNRISLRHKAFILCLCLNKNIFKNIPLKRSKNE